jgi:hypothetical protein
MAKITVDVDMRQWIEARQEFLFRLGVAMAEWANVERGFYYWFAAFTKLNDPMARSIFYGAKGFGARADMVESTIPFAQGFSDVEIKLVELAVKKARNYSGFRNSLAHGEPIPIVSANGGLMVMKMGDAKRPSFKNEITVDEISLAAVNFATLATALIRASQPLIMTPGESTKQFLSLIQQLPNQANSKSDPTPAGSGKPHERQARPNNKVHRAEMRAAKEKRKGEA